MISKLILFTTAVIFSSVLLAGEDSESSMEEHSQSSMQEMDADGDGQLSQEEVAANPELQKNWDSLDTNQDGNMSESEFSAFQEMESGAERDTEVQVPDPGSIPEDTSQPEAEY